MKKLATLIFLIVTQHLLTAQTFCEGWEAGYAAGKASINDKIYITPICPIPGINQDNYQSGYNMGYEKATGSKAVVMPEQNKGNNYKNDNVYSGSSSQNTSFCNGWDDGYRAAMAENNDFSFIIPFCPIPGINEDTYESGFARGYQKGLDKLGKKKESSVIVPNDENKNFCTGWEKGYTYGLQEWAAQNNTHVPIKITPVCPLPEPGKNTYQTGFDEGKARALKDME